jgi:hypothetical protein
MTFLAYGAALRPFFVFDYRPCVVVPILAPLGLLDAVGNVVMLVHATREGGAVTRHNLVKLTEMPMIGLDPDNRVALRRDARLP